MDTSKLAVWLSFDDDATTDFCGNSFSATKSVSISDDNAISGNALQLSGGAYIQSDNKILIGGQDFTIDCWAYAGDSQVAWAGIFALSGGRDSFKDSLYLGRFNDNSYLRFHAYKTNGISVLGSGDLTDSTFLGERHHYAVVYLHDSKNFLVFVDGVLKKTVSLSAEFARAERYVYVGRSCNTANRYFQGSIDEFRIFDGVALWTENFTPPAAISYFVNTPRNIGVSFQTLRKVYKDFNADFQTCIKFARPFLVQKQFQTLRRVGSNMQLRLDFQTMRKVAVSVNVNFQTKRVVTRTVNLAFSTCRHISRTFNQDFQTLRKLAYLLDISKLKSIDISISEQQLTDRLSFTSADNFEILQQVKGSFLDYSFNLRIESLRQTDIFSSQPLTTCQCCSDIDSLLYTQIAYTTQKITWNDGLFAKDDDGKTHTIKKPTSPASSHISHIARILRKKLIFLCGNFSSTVDINQDGVTYQDLISEIFGWTSRIPTKLVNVFIRGDTLYVIQRGYEQNVIDISNLQLVNVVVEKSLYRTSFGVTRDTEDLEKTKTHYEREWVYGNEIPEDDDNNDDNEPLDEENILPSKVTTEDNGVTTTITYEYDEDGNVVRTVTETDGGDTRTRTVVENEYETTNGQKLLAAERTTTYDYENGGLPEYKTVRHQYLTQGQQHITGVGDDGAVLGSITSPARNEDRPTAYDRKNRDDGKYFVERDGHIFIGGSSHPTYVYQNGKKVEVLGWIDKPVEETTTGTLETVKLYDSSFPVGDNDAQYYTAELRRLNRTIQETVTLEIYNHSHIFDFNDRIIFCGKEFFLQSNSFSADSDIVNKQSLQLVRWYK